MKKDTITGAELAELLGIDERSVRKLAARGIAVRRGRGGYAIESVTRYCAALRDAGGRGGERTRLVSAQADQVELKNAQMRGELLVASEVEARWCGIVTASRSAMLAVPSRIQQRLPHLTKHDVSEIDHEVRAALTELGGTADASKN